MNNTEFVTEQNKDVYLFSTEVENLMINEFFTSANGDSVFAWFDACKTRDSRG